MAKLVELKEAAEMLGITPDELNDLRSRNEIFGYRDGPTWKFKLEEVERVAAERVETEQAGTPGQKAGESGIDADLNELVDVDDLELDASEPTVGDDLEITEDIELDMGGSGADLGELDLESPEGSAELEELELEDDDETESILVSEKELGESDESTSSTIIGKLDQPLSTESDLQLTGDRAEAPVEAAAGSGVELTDDAGSGGSDVLSADEGGQAPGEAADSGDTAILSLDVAGTGDSDALEITIDEELVSEEGQVDLGAEGAGASGVSGFGSALELDEDLVLGSGTGSDVTISPNDSGINLAKPSDSGLSLEDESFELGGSAVESLELGEDDMLSLSEETDPEAATQLKADDDFLLTPVAEAGDEESDSGSQVIALDTEEFDESAATMLATDAVPMLEEDTDLLAAEEQAAAAAGPALGTSAPLMAPAEVPEAPYSIWNVLSLFFIVVSMAFTGILMMDLVKNMWSWEGTYSFNSSIMDSIIEMLGG